MHAAECLAELVEEASREELSPVTFLDRALEREIERKDDRGIATSLRLSGLPVGKTLEGFDWTFQPTADRSRFETPAMSAFIREADNVLFMGPGVSQTHKSGCLFTSATQARAQGLGNKGCQLLSGPSAHRMGKLLFGQVFSNTTSAWQFPKPKGDCPDSLLP